tara:strand:+ start:1628 stop:2023 length:396 start_codon:yes stop_codon:yes gene_type:complete
MSARHDMTVTTVIVVALVSFVGGGAAGIAIKGNNDHKTLQAQAQSIDAILDGQTEILTEATKPVVLDAELRATLADTPPACVSSLGGDPLSPQCMLMACWQYGQSTANRPSCQAVEALAVEHAQNGASSRL